jgi:TonB family protein
MAGQQNGCTVGGGYYAHRTRAPREDTAQPAAHPGDAIQGLVYRPPKGAGTAKSAHCLVSLWYSGDGVIRAAQLLRVSGFPQIDQRCLQVVIGQRVVLPPSEREFGGWTRLPINWIFVNNAGGEQQLHMERDPSIPALASDGALFLLPAYPPTALAQHAQGICKMHVTVSAGGAVDALEITQSTGSTALDHACKDAIYGSPFVPAANGSRTVSGTTDIAIDWRLPSLDGSR